MKKSAITVIPSFFENYINCAPDLPVLDALAATSDLTHFISSTSLEEKRDFAYAPGKWTVVQVLQHMIDTERIFGYRALRFARNDSTELPGFDEALFAENAPVANRSVEQLLDEFSIVRRGTILLFSSFTQEAMLRKGVCNHYMIDVLGIGFAAAGHVAHHINILKERYFLL